MAKKLFVGGIPYSTTDEELKDHFSQAGSVVSAQIIMDKFSGRSKGFGFVEMSNDDEANKAIEMFNGQDFGGRKLAVNEARPKTEGRGGFGGGRGGFGGGQY
ncbi:MAG: RNA recognition motif domain-containing protein [Candidatus Saccharibacteria bacterium]